MTDRAIPAVDGAPACPFVAFEDDRDGRGTAPDHRHRCFAEPRPAPRALAHQDAFCLSSSFPVCPTFQDWARREAAAARPAARSGIEPSTPVSQPMPPLDRDEYDAPGAEAADRRNQPRDWAAPPPWSSAAAGGAAGAAGAPRAGGGATRAGAAGAAGAAAAGAGATGAGATGAGASGAGAPGAAGTAAGAAGAAAAATGAGWAMGADTPPEGRGLAGSAADRLAGPDAIDELPPVSPRTAPAGRASSDGTASARPVDDDHGRDARPVAAGAAVTAAGSSVPAVHDDLDDGPDWGDAPAWAVAASSASAPVARPRPPYRDPPDAAAASAG